MNYIELVDAFITLRDKSNIKQFIPQNQVKTLETYFSDYYEQKEELAEQLMDIIRFSNIPLKMNFFEKDIEKERKYIENKLWNDLKLKEIHDLSSIIGAISRGSLSTFSSIKSDENKTDSVKRFSFLLTIISEISKIPLIDIYESTIKHKNRLYEYYEDKYNVITSFLSKYSRFFIERSYFLVCMLWFGGDNFEHFSEEYFKNFTFHNDIYKDIINRLVDDKIITISERSIIKINKKGIDHIRLSLVMILSYWSMLFGEISDSKYVLPHTIFSRYMLFGENYNMKMIKKGKQLDYRKKRPSYKLLPKVYEYTYIYWSNIFDIIYHNPFLDLKDRYEDVRLFVIRYSLSPLFQDIVTDKDSIRYKELIRILEELNIVKIISRNEYEVIVLSKNILGWLFENKKENK